MARASAKPAAPGINMPPPSAPGPSASLPALPTQERRPASPTHAVEAAVSGAEVSLDISVGDYTMGGVTIFDAHTGRGPAGEFFCFLNEVLLDRGAGAETGQLAVVPAPAAASAVAVGAKGPTQDPWARFCASEEIASAAAAKDLAGSAVQQLKHVTAFTERIASGALTSEFAAERR